MANPLTSTTTTGGPPFLMADETLRCLLEWRPPPITGPKWDNHTYPGRKDQSAPPDSHTAQPQRSQEADFMCMLLESQQHSLIQAQNNRLAAAERIARIKQASAERIARLEVAILLLSVRPEAPDRADATPAPPSDRINLQTFCIADGPSYSGLFHAVEPFLKWLLGVQIFFATKAVTHNTDKILIVGGLIREISTLSFYLSSINVFVQLSWSEFKHKLLELALPSLWRTKLRHQIHKLAMGNTETFLASSTRARTLQSMVNFDDHSFSDFALAEFVVSGLPDELKAQANNFELLEKTSFVYGAFESKLQRFYDNLPQRTTGRTRQLAPAAASATPAANQPSKDDTIWRIHSFLNLQGQCHHCKATCGSAPGACLNPVNQAYINIPTAYVAPLKPSNYKPPKAWSAPRTIAGKPTQAPAGRSTTVAGITEDCLFPNLNAASVAAFAAIEKELRLAKTEEYVKPPGIVILLQCGDRSLRGLVDNGSEINLISNAAVQRLSLGTVSLLLSQRQPDKATLVI
ncbi:hypothetical protein PCASD_25191 [Puccinia coronata f. sp. avenae]|uniref:Uncharacterized protein n=1 Tax=Puccinia coronata f. sp. avenae TaxID=200324 RepID=A0A2N5SI58_9BASI|nr:hypothetical protein PCASD_25191 [Puccinia coronata f. sp. avenae]